MYTEADKTLYVYSVKCIKLALCILYKTPTRGKVAIIACTPSSGSAEALIGIARMSFQSLQVAVVFDVLDVLVVVVVVVRVMFLIPLQSLFMVPLH